MDELIIHTYTAPEEGCCASSHWARLGDKLVLFDGQMLKEDAVLLREQMLAESGVDRPDLVVVTGPNVEHYGALAEIVDANTEILSTTETARSLRRRGQKAMSNLAQEYGGRAVSKLIMPTRKLGRTEEMDRAPFTWQFTDLKKTAGWGGLICFIPQKRVLIAGDLVFNRVHPNLAKVDIDQWRQTLLDLQRLGARHVYPGHGQPAGGDILSHLVRYLDHFRLAVSYFTELRVRGDSDLFQNIVGAITDKYPDYLQPGNLERGIEREIRRQRDAA